MINKLIKKFVQKISIKKFFFPNMPLCATLDEWDNWHQLSRESKPLKYFMAFDLISILRRNFYFRISNIYNKFRLKYIKRFNQINIKTLNYDYHDIDTRLVHGMFALLLEFVENEKASMYEYLIGDNKENKKELKKLSNIERGIKYLEWETSLDQDPTSTDYSPVQAAAAKEILQLLEYWVARKNTYQSDITNKRKLNTFGVISSTDLRKLDVIQIDYDEKLDLEEEEMLTRLIKIRKHLWT